MADQGQLPSRPGLSEEALCEAGRLFLQVFHACPAAISVSRLADGLVINANERLFDVTGYRREEVIDRKTLELGLWADPEDRERAVRALRKGGIVHDFQMKIRTKSGELRDVVASFASMDVAGEPCLLAIAADVTDRVRAEEEVRRLNAELEQRVIARTEEALRESEERLRTTLDGMLEGCQIIGFDWRYLYVNDAVARHGRSTKDELLGHTMMQIYPGMEQTEVFGYLRRCMEERIPHRMENQFIYPDGAEAWFELSIQPVPEGIFILSLDITERRRMEETLEQMREELEAKVERQLGRRNPYKLTFRELTVLHLVTAGRADKAIAGELGISPLTVHKHVANILGKMRVGSRTEAGVRAVREGLVE